MRGEPEFIDVSCRECDRVARDKFAEERESYRAESEADDKPSGRRCAGVRDGKHTTSKGWPCWSRVRQGERFCKAHRKQGERERAQETRQSICYAEGVSAERRRILDGIAHLERETVALWQEGTPVTKAVAAYTAAVRKIVEGEGK